MTALGFLRRVTLSSPFPHPNGHIGPDADCGSLCPLQISRTSGNFCSLSQATTGHVQETQLELLRTSHACMSCVQLPLEKNASPLIASCRSLADASLWMVLVQDRAKKGLLGYSCSFWLLLHWRGNLLEWMAAMSP